MTTPDPLALATDADLLAALTRRWIVGAERREVVPDTLFALAAVLRAVHEENKRLVTQAAELGKWRDAVLNAAVVDWTYRKEHETDPVRAVNDLVCYALDVERDALREENRRLREALTDVQDYYCRCTCGEDHTERCQAMTDALAGGKGEG